MIVVDASVAVQWVAREPGAEMAIAVLQRNDLVAPALLQVEVANAFRRKIAAGDITATQASEGFLLIAQRVELRPPTPAWLDRALEIALAMAHPIYDCLYLALAEANGARLVTRDLEFIRRAGRISLGHLVTALPLAAQP